MTHDPISEYQAREALRAREKKENDRAIAKARRTKKTVSFIAHDGCEVTVTPNGNIFYNAADWW